MLLYLFIAFFALSILGEFGLSSETRHSYFPWESGYARSDVEPIPYSRGQYPRGGIFSTPSLLEALEEMRWRRHVWGTPAPESAEDAVNKYEAEYKLLLHRWDYYTTPNQLETLLKRKGAIDPWNLGSKFEEQLAEEEGILLREWTEYDFHHETVLLLLMLFPLYLLIELVYYRIILFVVYGNSS